MPSTNLQPIFFNTHYSEMLKILNGRFRRLCSRLRWQIRRRIKSKVVIKRFGKTNSKSRSNGFSVVNPNAQLRSLKSEKLIRIATFNAALFSMAPAVPQALKSANFDYEKDEDDDEIAGRDSVDSREMKLPEKSRDFGPKSILKQSPLHPNTINSESNLSRQQKFAKSKLRVSINLPDNEISLLRNQKLNNSEVGSSSGDHTNRVFRGKSPMRSNLRFSANSGNGIGRTVLEVLRELDADILALQDVKAEEEKSMKPLSDLATALGMNYVFAESWAPEYGNAVLSKWPIKRSKVQKIFDDTDFRNVLKATIDIPHIGEMNFHCTHLDHLDENWRMKQINSIIQSDDQPHILAGGLNSLDETDYSTERWTDIVKYYEEMGKPTPKVEVMKLLKSKQYTDAKDFAGQCESVVMIAKGQNVQGTCKYGTRVDYILGTENSAYEFVPGSYSVFSSKGTSDHHIVKVDVTMLDSNSNSNSNGNITKKQRNQKQRISKKMTSS